MVNQLVIQRHVNKGYGKAAARLGAKFAHYRPSGSGEVLTNYNMIDELMLAFDPDPGFTFGKPNAFKSTDIYYGLCDLSSIAIGDYFYDFADHTFFCANFEPLKPALFVRCSRTVSIFRPATSNGYSGDTAPVTLMSNWPVSMELGTKGERQVANLPESVRAPWVIVHMPSIPNVPVVMYGDIIVDELGRRYAVADNHLLPYPAYHITADYVSP